MPSFGSVSLKHLATCHKDAQVIMSEVVRSFDCTVLEGHRNNSLQQEYFERGLSKKPPGESLHNYMPSMAWHAMPYFVNVPHVDWKHESSMFFLAGVILGTADRLLVARLITHAVRWGGDWDRDFDVREKQWNDLSHYELVNP